MFKIAQMMALSLLAVCYSALASYVPHPPVTLEISGVGGKHTNLTEINTILRSVGAYLSVFNAIPASAVPILQKSTKGAITQEESDQLLTTFAINISEVKYQRETLAGRPCNTTDCGNLATEEVGIPPYPKVYSLKNMQNTTRAAWGFKLGRLHVNAAPSIGQKLGEAKHLFTEEVHTLLSGGPNVWYWSRGWGRGVIRLTMGRVVPGGPAWRITFPGSTPHGGMFTKTVHHGDTVCVSSISGPPAWFMSYTLTGVEDPLIGDNPWIDFSNPHAPEPREAEAAATYYKKMMDFARAQPSINPNDVQESVDNSGSAFVV